MDADEAGSLGRKQSFRLPAEAQDQARSSMKIKGNQPSVIGNWFWCDPFGDRTNPAICRERIARQLAYSPCRDCRRFGDVGQPRQAQGSGRRD